MSLSETNMILLSPLTLGGYSLRNRIAMAPMTRSRADALAVPFPLAAEYYASRADAGLILILQKALVQVPWVWVTREMPLFASRLFNFALSRRSFHTPLCRSESSAC